MRKKEIIFYYLLLLFFILFFSFVFRLDKVQGKNQLDYGSERIEDYDVSIKIDNNSDLLVRERIVYNFGSYQRHGIYRYIPLKKIDGKKIRIENVSVKDDKGNPYKVKIWKAGILRPILYIRIGDPHTFIEGSRAYIINYRVNNALFFGKNTAETYWNVVGPDWRVPIKNLKVRLFLPEKISSDNLSVNCFTGYIGSQERDCQYNLSENGEEVDFSLFSSIRPRESFSIKVDVPNRIVAPPSVLRVLSWKIKDNFLLFIPLISFIFLFMEWDKKGRDPRLPKIIVPCYFPPKGLKPLLMGALWKEKITPNMITTTIIDLAVRGFLLIREEKREILKIFPKKDYLLIRKQGEEELLDDYEKDIIETLFSGKDKVKLSGIKKKDMSALWKRINRKAFDKLVRESYFPKSPLRVKKLWVLIGSILIAVGLGSYGRFPLYNYYFLISTITGLIFLGFGMIMPKRTKKGGKVYLEILGFKEFIEKAEKYKAQFEENENIFEKYLPYAILFGCTSKWVKAFEGIYRKRPIWYQGGVVYAGGSFSSTSFEKTINSLSASLCHSIGGSGGGVGAGGGTGGGGGGSW